MKKDLEAIAYLNMQRKYATYAFLNIPEFEFALSSLLSSSKIFYNCFKR